MISGYNRLNMEHVTLSIRLPADLHSALSTIAEREDRSLNYVVRAFLSSAVAEQSADTQSAETTSGSPAVPSPLIPRVMRLAS